MEAIGTVGAWLAVAVIGTIGALLLIVGVAGWLRMVVLLWRGWRTTATVAGDTSPGEDPKFSFTDENGQTHVVSQAVASLKRKYHAGAEVPLIYLPERPETFVVDRFGDKWGILLFLLLLGLMLLLPCLAFVFGPPRFIFTRAFATLAFLTFGVACMALGFVLAVRALRFQQRAAQAVAIISQAKRGGIQPHIDRAGKEGRKFLTELPPPEPGQPEPWIIRVEFEDLMGTKRQATALVSKPSAGRAYEVGEQVSILYDPECPWDIRIDTSLNWFGPFLLGIFGVAFLAAALVLWSGAIPFE